jgi:methanogenic corrinoid protein MtbC1
MTLTRHPSRHTLETMDAPHVGDLKRRFLDAQLSGNRHEAVGMITEAIGSGVAVPELHIHVIQAAQYEIGRLWERNVINVAMEHQATAIAQLALAALYERLPRSPPNGKRVLLACVEGELHDMGPRIAADFLEMDGFDVRFLGASVPAHCIATRAEECKPDLVALSATMTFHLGALRAAVAALRTSRARAVPILVGGRAFAWSPDAQTSLDVQGFGADASELVAVARRLLVDRAAWPRSTASSPRQRAEGTVAPGHHVPAK